VKTDPLSKAEREGYAARERGLDRTTNPYRYRTFPKECIAWARGFAAARTDLARKRRKAKNGDSK
jgi:hypothetical protein